MSQERWFGDYRSAGLVDWPDGLRDIIHDRYRRYRRNMWRWLAAPLGILVLGSAGSIIAAIPGVDAHPLGVLGVSLIAGVAAFALVVLPANDARQASKVALKVWASESLERFAVCPAAVDVCEKMNSVDRELYLRDVPLEILVVPKHDIVLQHDRSPNILLGTLPIMTLGCTDRPEVELEKGTLPLTASELEEINRRRAMVIKPLWKFLAFYVALTVAMAGLLVLLVLSPSTLQRDISFSVLVSLVWIYSTWVLIFPMRHRALLAYRLGRDLVEATCDVLDGDTALDELYATGLPEELRPELPPRVVRRLRHSGLWWLLDDTPAMWRRYPS